MKWLVACDAAVVLLASGGVALAQGPASVPRELVRGLAEQHRGSVEARVPPEG